MAQRVLFLELLLLHCATQHRSEMQANCYDDVAVMCPGVNLDSMDFISVAWYKILTTADQEHPTSEQLNNQLKLGIIRRGKDNKTTQYYKFPRSLKPLFGEKYSLLLPSVTPGDSGIYQCEVSADIRGQNLNLEVNLKVQGCVTQTDLTTMQTALNTTQSDLLCHKQVKDLPVMWGVIGYVAVGFAKIILSLFSIWVIQAAHTRSSRRQHKW